MSVTEIKEKTFLGQNSICVKLIPDKNFLLHWAVEPQTMMTTDFKSIWQQEPKSQLFHSVTHRLHSKISSPEPHCYEKMF